MAAPGLTGEGADADPTAESASLAQSLSGRRAQLQALAQADRAAAAEEHEAGEVEDEEEEEVPLECLRYFKLLNRRARRSANIVLLHWTSVFLTPSALC